ncbi:MAG: sugar nucleotide-binding protein [Armatimonadota bacterium]|nr:sugar nucleotide-binding protein [Armatimonadota bacterium]MDR7451999.1 sugar nucleotide-binding protein [Armatimonadota bacterium]MDR7467890.1 sugar nucleotide-binding protein [Armatimonadota bacterium]MDR7494257.1 sugar nucleotide-binding protein [Armatimonadota bacterium]MDR7500038.1 sugar nucleotide-binding protein [Armatimonadota bacterium]
MTHVLVLGASGMLGSMVTDVLARAPDLAVTATVRDEGLRAAAQERLPSVEWLRFDAATWDPRRAPLPGQRPGSWVINCIGITKPLIRDDHPAEVLRALQINSLLPYALAEAVASAGGRMIQIATDCVFSGRRGAYTEADPHDPLDVYGKSKSLGEPHLPGVHHLRCSIIGPEPKDYKFLLEWFVRQPRGASVQGYRNHRWNGVTTLHFARVCLGVITSGLPLPPLHHLVPGGALTKAEMLHVFSEVYGRQDIAIREVDAKDVIDRTLATTDPATNAALWAQAGYVTPPTVPEMIRELGRFDYRLAGMVAVPQPTPS